MFHEISVRANILADGGHLECIILPESWHCYHSTFHGDDGTCTMHCIAQFEVNSSTNEGASDTVVLVAENHLIDNIRFSDNALSIKDLTLTIWPDIEEDKVKNMGRYS